MQGTPTRVQVRMIAAVYNICKLPFLIFCVSLVLRLGKPKMYLVDLIAAQLDPGGPRLARDQLVHCVAKNKAETSPDFIQPKIR